jgi:dolichol-phosphate mannosyltransferase
LSVDRGTLQQCTDVPAGNNIGAVREGFQSVGSHFCFVRKGGLIMATALEHSDDIDYPYRVDSIVSMPPLAVQTEFPTESLETRYLSVIIPTRNEAGNIDALLQRLAPVIVDLEAEVLFVDDSDDSTPRVIADASTWFHSPVRLIHRNPGNRSGGLGGAVLEGIRQARGTYVVVMDGDLQHPPETIIDLLNQATTRSLDLVVASRYCENGDATAFNRVRATVSHASTVAAKLLFPGRLRYVNDPMSGYFLARRSAIQTESLRPNGFKILLEIIGRTPDLRIGSVPFVFGERFAEASKASLSEGIRLMRVLCALRFGPSISKFWRFGLVGVSGLVVNLLLLAFFTETVGLFYLVSLVLATQGSTLWNFLLTETWVFKGRKQGSSKLSRATLFFLMNNLALLARGPMVFVMASLLGLNYLLANVASMAVILVLRFTIADSLIWKSSPRTSRASAPVISVISSDEEIAA